MEPEIASVEYLQEKLLDWFIVPHHKDRPKYEPLMRAVAERMHAEGAKALLELNQPDQTRKQAVLRVADLAVELAQKKDEAFLKKMEEHNDLQQMLGQAGRQETGIGHQHFGADELTGDVHHTRIQHFGADNPFHNIKAFAALLDRANPLCPTAIFMCNNCRITYCTTNLSRCAHCNKWDYSLKQQHLPGCRCEECLPDCDKLTLWQCNVCYGLVPTASRPTTCPHCHRLVGWIEKKKTVHRYQIKEGVYIAALKPAHHVMTENSIKEEIDKWRQSEEFRTLHASLAHEDDKIIVDYISKEEKEWICDL
jgi:hypothetical protein